MAGIDDIEREETPQETLTRLIREGRSLTSADRVRILTGKWQDSNNTSPAPQTTESSTGNVSTLANSDPTNPNTSNNLSGMDTTPPPQRPVDPPVDQTSYLYYDIWLKKGISPYEDLTPHKPKMYYTNEGALIASLPRDEQLDENAVRHRYRFCRCEGDPDNVAEIRANARMGFAPRGGSDRARVIREAGYYVKFPENADPNNPNSSYAPDFTEPLWILNQRNEVQYIGDDKCPEGRKRYTADNVQLGKEDNITEPIPDPKPEDKKDTITYEKVEIQRIELKGADVFLNGAKGPKIESIKYPPIIIDSITIPSGSEGKVTLPDLEIIKEPFIVEPQSISGDPPKEIIDDVRIEPMKFIGDEFIKIKDNLPITFRSVTMPAVIIDSLEFPKPLPENAQLPPIVASDEVIYLPEKEYSFADFQPSEITTSDSNADVKGETILLKNVELKVPIKDKTTSLKFWKVMVDKPEIKLEDEKNEQLIVKIPNVMIPISPKPTQNVEKLITSKLLLNHNLIKYVPDEPQPTEKLKDKYIIYTMTGKTVPPVGDVYFDDDDGSTIYYGVNQPYRDKTPVKNEFEYCKCSGDTGETSYQRANARLGILQGGSLNKKYFKRTDRDVIAGTIGVYIGDDKCPEGESELTNAQNPDNTTTLIPDKEEVINISDITLDLKDIVSKNFEKFDNLPQESIDRLPKITINNIEIPIILENGGTAQKDAEKIPVPFEKLEKKEVVSENNIIVQEEPPKPKEQITVPPPKAQDNIGGKGKGEKNGKGDRKGKGKEKKEKPKKKGGKDKLQKALEAEAKKAWYNTLPVTDIGAGEAAINISKGRDIPKAPGNGMPKDFVGKGVLQGVGHSRRWHNTNTFADWQWLWPMSSKFNPGPPNGPAETWVAGNSRPSDSGGPWWEYLSNWNRNEPAYGSTGNVGGEWTGGDVTVFFDRIGRFIMFDEQYAPFSMKRYNQSLKKMQLSESDVKGNPKLGKVDDWVKPPINYTYRIWRTGINQGNITFNNQEDMFGEWQYSRSALPGTQYPYGFRHPYMVAGKGLIRQYIPRAFNADWNTLLSKFRLSKKVDPEYVDPNAKPLDNTNLNNKNKKNKDTKPIPEYGGPLPLDYKCSLLDVGIIMNFFQSGYVNRYKLPGSGNFPPLASSGTGDHLMMVHTVTPDWVKGRIRIDPMVGTFNRKSRINLNWAHEPHWCGISTDFFLRKGGFDRQGTTSVKSNESALINGGFPLNRPRLEETIEETWQSSKWELLGGVGTTIREVYRRAYVKHGRENFEHPITPEYLNEYKDKINSIWFIENIHFQKDGKGQSGKLTQLGYDLIRKVLNPDIIDWPAATISHTGHVESVAGMDVDSEVMRLGGNTSTDGKRGTSNNTMGLFLTNLADFSGYPPSADRGGFVVIGRPEGYKNDHVIKARTKAGIAAPWIITPVMQTYFDFVELNPDPEYPVYNTYWQRINTINTVFQSKNL